VLLSAWLKAEACKPRKQRRNLKQLHLDLKELGYEGSYDRVAAFARQWKVGQSEWVNSASKRTGCDMPALLLQTLYIDLFGAGLDAAIRQTVDVVSGKNTYSPENTSFSNLHAKIRIEGARWIVTVEATQFMEPISSFGLFFTNDLTEFTFDMPGEGAYKSGGPVPMTLSNGTQGHCKFLGLDRAMTPGHPVVMAFTRPDHIAINLPVIVMHQYAAGQFKSLPVTAMEG
jgi:hypothetical protein